MAAMRSKSDALMAPTRTFVVRGTSALASTRNREQPMNATTVLKKSNRPEEDSNLAAVSEVEAGIRDFVRNDIAYLRRPAPGVLTSSETLPDTTPESIRQQRQLADPARRRNLAGRNRKPDFRARSPARTAACRRPARAARDLRLCPAQPGRDEIHAHDRRQCRAVEAYRRRAAQQLIARSRPATPAVVDLPPPPANGARRLLLAASPANSAVMVSSG